MYSEVFGFCRILVDIAWLFIRILISQGSPWAVEREDAVLLLYPAVGDARPPAAPATPAPATCAQLSFPLSSMFSAWTASAALGRTRHNQFFEPLNSLK